MLIQLPFVFHFFQVNYELLLEKDCQLRDLENKLGEYIASLQFQKTVKKIKMLELYTAIISVQALLFEQLSMSKTLSKLECIQILETHNPVSNEVVRKKNCQETAAETVAYLTLIQLHWFAIPHSLVLSFCVYVHSTVLNKRNKVKENVSAREDYILWLFIFVTVPSRDIQSERAVF